MLTDGAIASKLGIRSCRALGRIWHAMEPELTPESGILIPYEQLPSATLRSVIEEYVTRDGTELTDSAIKIESVLRLLKEGAVEVWFDPETQSCNILRR